MEYRLVPITDNISVPAPKDLPAEEEAQWIARYKETHDIAAMEAEYRELERDIREGKLIPADHLLEELEEMDRLEGIGRHQDEESA